MCTVFVLCIQLTNDMAGSVVRLHDVSFGSDLSVQPIIINFRQLFQARDAPAILPMVHLPFFPFI